MDDRQAVKEKMMAAVKRFGINSEEELLEAMRQGKGDLDIGIFVNPIPWRHNDKACRGRRNRGDDESASSGE